MMLLLKGVRPLIVTIAKRRYAICDEPVVGADPHGPAAGCGELIDVTDWPQVKATDSCGNAAKHRVDGAGPTPWLG